MHHVLAPLAIGYWTSQKTPGCLLVLVSIDGYMGLLGTLFYYASKADRLTQASS